MYVTNAVRSAVEGLVAHHDELGVEDQRNSRTATKRTSPFKQRSDDEVTALNLYCVWFLCIFLTEHMALLSAGSYACTA